MIFQFDVSTLNYPKYAPAPAAAAGEATELLRQLLEVEKEQLAHLRALTTAHNPTLRWRAFLERWREDFPRLGRACQQVVPMLEKTYSQLLADVTEHLAQNGDDAFTNEFDLQEFLDRYGVRLSQLAGILSALGPLAEASSQEDKP